MSRRIFWVTVHNNSDQDIRNVRAEIASVRLWTIHGEEQTSPVIANKTFTLQFQEGKSLLDLSPRMGAKLPLISHARQWMPGFIRLEGSAYELLHDSAAWKFTVKVTANGFLPVQRDFIASVKEQLLEMSVRD